MNYLICKYCPKLEKCMIYESRCGRLATLRQVIFDIMREELPTLHRCYDGVEEMDDD